MIEPGAGAVVAAAARVYGCVTIVFVSVCLSFPREVFDFSCSSRAIRMYRCIFCVVVVIAVAVSSSFHVFLYFVSYVHDILYIFLSVLGLNACVCVCVRRRLHRPFVESCFAVEFISFREKNEKKKKYFVFHFSSAEYVPVVTTHF